MDRIEVSDQELDEGQRRAFRDAAGERGLDGVVEWRGRPHLVIERRPDGDAEVFVLEAIPRPFG